MKFATDFCTTDERDLDVVSTKTFEQLMLHPKLIMSIKEVGYCLPTPVQATAIPLALRGTGLFFFFAKYENGYQIFLDLLVQSKSGTGKRLIYSALVAQLALEEVNDKNVVAVILTPTLEGAERIKETVDELLISKDFTW